MIWKTFRKSLLKEIRTKVYWAHRFSFHFWDDAQTALDICKENFIVKIAMVTKPQNAAKEQ